MPIITISEVRSGFDIIEDFSEEYRGWGYKALPISGRFIRNQVDLDAFVFVVKAILPSDARLVVVDGMSLRMMPYRDEYMMVFGSKEWPQVAEGAELPRLEPIFLGDYITGDPVWDTRVIGDIPVGVGLIVTLNKRTHKMVLRKEDETEDHIRIRIEPLEVAK